MAQQLPLQQPHVSAPAAPRESWSERHQQFIGLSLFVLKRLAFGLLVLVAIVFISFLGLDMARGVDMAEALPYAARSTLLYFTNLLHGNLGMTSAGSITLRPVPISTVLATDAATSRADDTIAQFFAEHVSLARRRAVPLVDGEGCYEGLVLLDDVLAVDPADWADTTLAEVAATELPVAGPDWTVGQALRQMVDANVDHLPVTDGEGRLRGMVTSDAIVDRNDLLERLSASRDARREHGI